MKILLLIIFGCLTGGLLAQPASSNKVEIVWTGPTNNWQSSLWVYKLVPQVFPPAMISNLLAMTAFKMADNTGTNGRWVYDWNDLNFETPDQKRHLWICPTYGYIEYEDSTAIAQGDKPSHGVLSDEQVYPLALDQLRKLAIDRSQLATRPSTNAVFGPNDLGIRREERSEGWIDQKTHKNVDYVLRRGIYFVRQVDGVQIDGILHGGVFMSFGDDAKLAALQVTWRGLEPHELRPTLTPGQIMEKIRQGHNAQWGPDPPAGIVTKIRIFGFDTFYRGEPGNTDPEKQMHYLEPGVMIYAYVGDGGTNDEKCFVRMPILPDK